MRLELRQSVLRIEGLNALCFFFYHALRSLAGLRGTWVYGIGDGVKGITHREKYGDAGPLLLYILAINFHSSALSLISTFLVKDRM